MFDGEDHTSELLSRVLQRLADPLASADTRFAQSCNHVFRSSRRLGGPIGIDRPLESARVAIRCRLQELPMAELYALERDIILLVSHGAVTTRLERVISDIADASERTLLLQ